MSRSIWKGPYFAPNILKLSQKISSNQRTPTQKVNQQKKSSLLKGHNKGLSWSPKIWSRNSIILPTFVGLRVLIYNGRKLVPVKIMPEMVGHKFGAFSPTRVYTKKVSSGKSKN